MKLMMMMKNKIQNKRLIYNSNNNYMFHNIYNLKYILNNIYSFILCINTFPWVPNAVRHPPIHYLNFDGDINKYWRQ